MQLMGACERRTELRRRNTNVPNVPYKPNAPAQPSPATPPPHPTPTNAKAGRGSRSPQWAPIRTPLALNEVVRALLGEQLLDALDAFEEGVIAEGVAEAQVA